MPSPAAEPDRLLARIAALELAFKGVVAHLLRSNLLQAEDLDAVREQALLTLQLMQSAGDTRFQVFGARAEEELRALFSSIEHGGPDM
jgi:hypothetical protein